MSGLLLDELNDSVCVRAKRRRLLVRATPATMSFLVYECFFFFYWLLFFYAEPVSPKMAIRILIALGDGTETWRLWVK